MQMWHVTKKKGLTSKKSIFFLAFGTTIPFLLNGVVKKIQISYFTLKVNHISPLSLSSLLFFAFPVKFTFWT